MTDNGYVYVLMNPSMQNLVKIGKTIREPEERAKELSSTTGVPTPFVVVYTCSFESCSEAESFVHSYLEDKGFRVSSNREFFEIPIQDAIDAVIKAREHFGVFEINNSQNLDESKVHYLDRKNFDNPDDTNEEIQENLYNANNYQHGFRGKSQDVDIAIDCYSKAIKLGSIEACNELGTLYLLGINAKQDLNKAKQYFEEGIRRGDLDLYSELAKVYLELNEEQSAYKCWEKYFRLGKRVTFYQDIDYLIFVGVYRRKIEFIDKLNDFGEELFDGFYNKSDIKVDGEYCRINPDFIEYARGVINGEINQEERMVNQIKVYISPEEEDGYDPDTYNVEILEALIKASHYQYGLNDELEDINKAIKYYLKAIKLGSIEACNELGTLYFDGDKVKQDLKKAKEYFEEAIERGDFSCYASLAQLYIELNHEENAYKCWKKYFTLCENIIYIYGVNYLIFVVNYSRKIEFIDRLNSLGEELFENLYEYNFTKLEDEVYHKFIEYARGVINGEINQEENTINWENTYTTKY